MVVDSIADIIPLPFIVFVCDIGTSCTPWLHIVVFYPLVVRYSLRDTYMMLTTTTDSCFGVLFFFSLFLFGPCVKCFSHFKHTRQDL
ncbi:hypothetical protein F4824DRAFT_457902 [Ustulina deusta]|nr:hypothetical protein F4824DRAFT_457902 [Ustulina deusta]